LQRNGTEINNNSHHIASSYFKKLEDRAEPFGLSVDQRIQIATTSNKASKPNFSFGTRNMRNKSVTLDNHASDYLLKKFTMPGNLDYNTLKRHQIPPLDVLD